MNMNTFSKKLFLTDNIDGQPFNQKDFGVNNENAVFQYAYFLCIEKGTLSFKFDEYDDYVNIPEFPFLLTDIRFDEIWLKPSNQSCHIELIVSFLPASKILVTGK